MGKASPDGAVYTKTPRVSLICSNIVTGKGPAAGCLFSHLSVEAVSPTDTDCPDEAAVVFIAVEAEREVFVLRSRYAQNVSRRRQIHVIGKPAAR